MSVKKNRMPRQGRVDAKGRKRLSAALVGCLLIVIGGCGTSKVQPTTIAFAQGQMAPPSSAMAGSTVQLAAIVQNDSANLGVSWQVTCNSPTNDCGSVDRHTASGVPATFVAPSTVPPAGTVTVVANSSAVPSQSATATISITPIVYGPISVSFSPAPPSTIIVGAAVSISVVVTNDQPGPNGKPQGATLSVTCSDVGACGSFIGSLYFAPAAVPTGGTITITATSVADPTKSASATTTITPPVVAISMVSPYPTSIAAGAATNLGAAVKDGTPTDVSGSQGVDWTVSCAAPSCGYFIPTHTSNDAAGSTGSLVTSFTAPTVAPPGGTVTVTASATADPTKQTSITLNVNAATLNNGVLKGQYAFLLNGVHLYGTSALAGSIMADGSGNITGGEEMLSGGLSPLVTGITGSYFIGSDGRGLMTLNGLPGFSFDWLNGQQVFAITAIDANHAFIEEFDGTGVFNITQPLPPDSWYGRTWRGELELQQTGSFATPPSGSFAFTWQHAGATISSNSCSQTFVCAAYYGGVLSADATGTINSFSIDRYVDGATSSIVSAAYGPQSFGAVDSFGYGTVNIGPYALSYFVVDSGNIIVLANFSFDQTGYPAGHIYAQPANVSLPAGNYVFTSVGSFPINSKNGAFIAGSSPQTAAGGFAADANGNLSGILDANNQGVALSANVTGTVISSAINGRLLLTMTGGGASQFAVYPTENHGLLMLQLDNGRSAIGTMLSQSSSGLAVQGNCGATLQQMGTINDAQNTGAVGLPVGTWTDIAGQLIVDTTSAVTGTIDVDQLNGLYLGPSGNFWTQIPGQPATGNIVMGSSGRATLSLATTLPSTTQTGVTLPGAISLVIYVVDSSTAIVMENDATPAVGMLQLQSF